MRHEVARERLPELLGLHPASSDESALREHVATCVECRGLLANLSGVDQALRGVGAEQHSRELDERVLTIPVGPVAVQVRRLRRIGWITSAVAVVASLTVALSLSFTRGDAPPPGFSAARTVTLTGATSGVRAQLQLGRPEGANQPLRLVAHGLSPVGARYYVLWLAGPEGRVSAATFRPDADGDCVVVGVAPRDLSWDHADITGAGNSSAEAVATGAL